MPIGVFAVPLPFAFTRKRFVTFLKYELSFELVVNKGLHNGSCPKYTCFNLRRFPRYEFILPETGTCEAPRLILGAPRQLSLEHAAQSFADSTVGLTDDQRFGTKRMLTDEDIAFRKAVKHIERSRSAGGTYTAEGANFVEHFMNVDLNLSVDTDSSFFSGSIGEPEKQVPVLWKSLYPSRGKHLSSPVTCV